MNSIKKYISIFMVLLYFFIVPSTQREQNALWSQSQENKKKITPMTDDLLILKNGRSVLGTFIAGTSQEISFKSGTQIRKYQISDVEGVVGGILEIPASQGLLPGIPQYRRGQYAKAIVLSIFTISSLAATTYWGLEWLNYQSKLFQPRLSRQTINNIQELQKQTSTFFITGAIVFGVIFVLNIFDWKYWGNNYRSMLANSMEEDVKKRNNEFKIIFSADQQVNNRDFVLNERKDFGYRLGIDINF